MEGDSDGGSRHKSEEETAKKHRAGDRVPGAGLWRRIQSQSRPSTLKTAPLFLVRAFTPTMNEGMAGRCINRINRLVQSKETCHAAPAATTAKAANGYAEYG